MNGAQDLGGRHGFGAVDPESEGAEPVFHAEWERRAFGLTMAAGFLGQWNIDELRHARESQHPVDYLRQSYYEIWMTGLEKLLAEKGLVTEEELAGLKPPEEALQHLSERRVDADTVQRIIEVGGPVSIEIEATPSFHKGDRVRAKVRNPSGHTREPSYVRGRNGVIHEHYGAHIFPDRNAHGERIGEHLYSVRFEAVELWGPGSESGHAVYVDLWESYLERP